MMSIHHKVCTCHLFFSWYKFWGLNFCKFSLLFMLVCCYLLLLSVNKQSKYFFHHWHLLTLTCWSSVLARVGQSICRTDSQVDHWPQRCPPSFQSHCLCGCHSCSKKDDLVWKTNPTEVHRLVRAHTHTHTNMQHSGVPLVTPYAWDLIHETSCHIGMPTEPKCTGWNDIWVPQREILDGMRLSATLASCLGKSKK